MTVHTENAVSVQVIIYLPVEAMPMEMIVSEEPYNRDKTQTVNMLGAVPWAPAQ